MSPAPRHTYEDAEIVELAVDVGCLAPHFDRARRPGLFQHWYDRAIRALAARHDEDLTDHIAEADKWCGQPPEIQSSPRLGLMLIARELEAA